MADPLKPSKLAGTMARTAPSIGIYLYGPNSDIRIGAVKSMSRTVNRGGVRRFELDAAIPGRTVEIIPGKIDALDITIRRAMLYSSDMMEAFGYPSVTDLVEQNVPIEVREYRYAKPIRDVNGNITANGDTDNPIQIVRYIGCYFTSNPQNVDIDGDWQIVQEATLMVSNVITSGGKDGLGGPTNPEDPK